MFKRKAAIDYINELDGRLFRGNDGEVRLLRRPRSGAFSTLDTGFTNARSDLEVVSLVRGHYIRVSALDQIRELGKEIKPRWMNADESLAYAQQIGNCEPVERGGVKGYETISNVKAATESMELFTRYGPVEEREGSAMAHVLSTAQGIGSTSCGYCGSGMPAPVARKVYQERCPTCDIKIDGTIEA